MERGHRALDTARAVHAREIDAVDVIDEAVHGIERVNPALNASVDSRYERARHEAAGIEARLDAGESLPLAGVPFVVADGLAVAGAVWSAGSMYRSGRVADHDASAVARLRAAGAIPIAVCNSAEVGFWIETTNPVYGRTSNPRNSERIAGGAAGGVAALVAEGLVPFGLAPDELGSVRLAAAFCGALGLKTTGGRAPLTGYEPLPEGKLRRYTALGVVAADAEDAAVVTSLISGPDGQDGAVIPMADVDIDAYDLTWKRILVCGDPGAGGVRTRAEVVREVERAADILHELGGAAEDWRPRQLKEAFTIWLSMVHEGYGLMHSFRDRIGPREETSVIRELAAFPLGRSRHSFAPLAMAALEAATKGSFLRIQRYAAEGRCLRERLETVLADGSLLLMPAWPGAVPRHGWSVRRPSWIAYTAIINAMELPAVTVPMARGRDGMPIAVQIVGGHGREDAVLAAARALSDATGRVHVPRLRRLIPRRRLS